MLWSPRLGTPPPAPAEPLEVQVRPARDLADALDLYALSLEPEWWAQRRAAAAYLLATLNPPRNHRDQWAQVAARLDGAAAPPNAWQCWPRATAWAPAQGWFGPYQNRLSGLRRAQLHGLAGELRPLLEKNDRAAFLERLPAHGGSRGPLMLALTLQPLSPIGREDLLSEDWWWAILMNDSNRQALLAGVRLSRGETPEMPYRWEGKTCVCWSPGWDGRDDGGLLEAPFDRAGAGDWIYRFR